MQRISNERGYSLLLLLSILGAAGILVFGAIQTRSIFLDQAKQNLKKQVGNSFIQRELEITFSHGEICSGRVAIDSQGNFTLGDLTPGAQYLSNGEATVAIQEMKVSNIVNRPHGFKRGTFTISSRAAGTAMKKNSVDVVYSEASGVLADCRLHVSAEDACALIDANWNASGSRCEICETIGGTWTNSQCVL